MGATGQRSRPVNLFSGEWYFLPRGLWLAGTFQPSAFGPTGQPYVSPGQSAAPPWVCEYPTSSKPQRGGPNPAFAMGWGIVGATVRAAPLGLHAGALPIPRAAPWADLGPPRWGWESCNLAMSVVINATQTNSSGCLTDSRVRRGTRRRLLRRVAVRKSSRDTPLVSRAKSSQSPPTSAQSRAPFPRVTGR